MIIMILVGFGWIGAGAARLLLVGKWGEVVHNWLEKVPKTGRGKRLEDDDDHDDDDDDDDDDGGNGGGEEVLHNWLKTVAMMDHSKIDNLENLIIIWYNQQQLFFW